MHYTYRIRLQVFKTAPGSFFSDGDGKILDAYELMAKSNTISGGGTYWPRTKHYLCVYHLSQNLFDHVHAAFGSNQVHSALVPS